MIDVMQVVYTRLTPTNVNAGESLDGFRILSGTNRLALSLPQDGQLRIISANGNRFYSGQTASGTHTFILPSGTYIVSFNGKVVKAVVSSSVH